jgi:hypothetical protein
VASAVDGLSIVEMDEAGGKLVLRFEKNGRTLHFDLRLGPKMETPPSAELLAADSELPTYETDALVTDANGAPFHTQMGGDSFLDPSWQTKPHIENFDLAGRLQDIQLLRDAGAAFRKLQVPAGLEQLRLAGIQIGHTVDNMAKKSEASAPSAPATGDGTLAPKDTISWGPSSVAKWDYMIYDQCLFGCTGKHSSVWLRGWSSSSGIVYNAYSCNHGSCAYYSDMNWDCTMSGWRTDDGTHSRFFYSETTTSNSTYNGGCSTGYNWSSVGGHNCNDDTQLEINAIYSDSSQSTTGGTCNSAGTNFYPPGCQ